MKDEEINKLIYYKESKPSEIKQIEDGRRTETNSDIKKMFLDDVYFKYDGSAKTANMINVAKEKLAAEGKNVLKLTEEDLEEEIEVNEKGYKFDSSVDNSQYLEKHKIQELVSKVSINKDSLGAFSILENTHTLDADYIYRDFKELIVELDYFDKEELSDKVEEVLQWPIPECGSGGWPIRKYEKSEIFYGTLINSKADLDMMKGKDIAEAEEQIKKMDDEIANPDKVTPSSSSPGGSGAKVAGSVDDFVSKGYAVHKEMEGNGWDYCVYTNQGSGPHMRYACPDPENCGQQHCNSLNTGKAHVCGLNSTIQEAVSGYHNSCCATFVSWVLKEAGFDLSDHPGMHGAHNTYLWTKAQGFTEITDYADMEPGDILFNNGTVEHFGHVQMLGNNGEWLNAGGVGAINDPPKAYNANFVLGMRPGLNGAKQPFEGYEPEQAVVSPVTGKIVEIGEVERENVETGKKETVGFIKIQALDHYITSKEGKNVKEQCTTEDATYKDNDTFDTQKLEGYDYFYEEYQGVLDGCILYIEGIDLQNFTGNKAENIKAEYSGDLEAADITQYEPNIVYNMTDDVIEAQAIWREEAKKAAVPFFTDSEGNLYIKEGTVIGKTRLDPDESTLKDNPKTYDEKLDMCIANGNYIRLILRDLKDSIMEDVERYFKIEDNRRSKCDFEQFAYYLGVKLEGITEDLGDSYGKVVLADNAGNTTAFGLTKGILGFVQDKLPNFGAHLAAGVVPKEEAQDAFILVLEASKEDIQKRLNNPLDDDDSTLFALMDLNHASPSMCYKVIDIYNNKNNNLSAQEIDAVFREHWGTNKNYEVGLRARGVNRGVLAAEGRFILYQQGSLGDEVIFDSETPWTEFCEGGGGTDLTLESSGLYHIEKGVVTKYDMTY